MRRFINTKATIEELELHGFWHRRLETLIITGISVHGVTGATTQAFWLSLCRQVGLPTSLAREQGPTELLRYLLQKSPAASFEFCIEEREDGTRLFRAPRVTEVVESTQEETWQGPKHDKGGNESCRQISLPPKVVPPCRRKPLSAAPDSDATGPSHQRPAKCRIDRNLADQFRTLIESSEAPGRWIDAPLHQLRPSRN
jgi:hypothetical protein